MAQSQAAAATATNTPRTSIPGLFGEWIRQGAEGVIATQKILLDLAAQQNALALTVLRERLGAFAPGSPKPLYDLAGKGIENFMEAQEVLLDLAARQNAIVAEGLKPALAGVRMAGVADVFSRSVDNFITMQKQFLKLAETQTEGAVQDLREGKTFDRTRLSTVARDGMKTFFESQKRFLDILEDQLATKPEAPPAEPLKAPDLFEMAKEGVDAFVEAQKRLLDLASDQIQTNVEFTREALTAARPELATTSLEGMMRKSIDSFVAAQKALVELASKPRRGAEPEPVAETVNGQADTVGVH